MRQGASSIIIPIAVVDDGVVGTDLSVVLNLTSGASYQVGGVATATIPVLDGGPRLSVDTTQVATRPDVVTGENGRFTITNARPTANSIVVFYSVGGTAVAGTDYTVLPGQVTMPASATEVYVDVIPLQGDKSARSLTLTLDLPKPATYVVQTGSGSATMTIQAPAQPTNINHELVYVGVARLADGRENPLTNGSFQLFLANNAGVALTAGMSADLSVSIVRAGTAVPGTNFTSIPATVTIPAGSLSVPVSVPVINDGAKNGDTQVDITVGTYPSQIQTASVIIYADTTDNSGGGTPRPTVGSGGSGGCGVGSGIGLILTGFGVALAARLRRRRDAA